VEAGLNIRCEKTLQLGGSHDHPITLHIRSGAASGNDSDLAGVPGSKQHGISAGKITVIGGEENRQVLARRNAQPRLRNCMR